MLDMNLRKSNIYKELSEKYHLPIPVIEVICHSPFKFAKEKISDDKDWKNIMFAYLFKIKPKRKHINEINKAKS